MKRYLPFILIIAFLFPVLGQAASIGPVVQPAVSEDTATTSSTNIPANKGFFDIYTRLSNLSAQTQLAINQLNATGIATDASQAALLTANMSLAKVKIDITSDDTPKTSADKTEFDLSDAKAHLLDSLTALKASLPTLDTSTQS
jgi:hypothetical protein